MQKKIGLAIFLMASAYLFTGFFGCEPSLPPTSSGGGFFIETEFIPFSGPITPVPSVTTRWTWNGDVSGFNAVGDPSTFQNTTNAAAIGVSENGRVPAFWFVQWLAGGPAGCIGAVDAPGTIFQSNPQRTTEVFCIQPPPFGSADQIGATGDFSFSPLPLYSDGSSGNTATISGSGFKSQYGMPLVRYYDSSGNLVNQANVTAIASDGSWATGPIPDISQVSAGSYVGVLFNPNASGGYDFLGTVSVAVMDPYTPPANGGCGDGPPYRIDCN